MSYRYRIKKKKKREYSKIRKCKTVKEIAIATNTLNKYEEDGNYLWSGAWLGKYEVDEVWDMAFELNKNKTSNSFFTCKELNNIYNDDETLFKIKQEDLYKFIVMYEDKVKDYYIKKFEQIQELKKTDKDEALEVALDEIRGTVSEWNIGAIDTKLDRPKRICKSWRFEYGIFDLLLLYKTTNFNTHVVFISAR